jgi:hypothetical protein
MLAAARPVAGHSGINVKVRILDASLPNNASRQYLSRQMVRYTYESPKPDPSPWIRQNRSFPVLPEGRENSHCGHS